MRGDHLQGDRRDEVVTQANGRLVLARRLDRRGDLDLALVELAEAGSRNGVGDVGGLDRTEEATPSPALTVSLTVAASRRP